MTYGETLAAIAEIIDNRAVSEKSFSLNQLKCCSFYPKYDIINPCLFGKGECSMVEKYPDNDFEALLGSTITTLKEAISLKGVVCAYESDGAIVDIGSKCTAFVPSYEVSSDRKVKAEDVVRKRYLNMNF